MYPRRLSYQKKDESVHLSSFSSNYASGFMTFSVSSIAKSLKVDSTLL